MKPLPEPSKAQQASTAGLSNLLHLYVERFNQRDWDGLRELISADARLRVADRFSGRLVDSPYFGRYERWTVAWQMAEGEVDGEPVVMVLDRDRGAGEPLAIVRVDATDGHIVRIVDYQHCPWVLSAAASVVVGESRK